MLVKSDQSPVLLPGYTAQGLRKKKSVNVTLSRQKAVGNQGTVTEVASCSVNCQYYSINDFQIFGNLEKIHLLCLDLLLYSAICHWQLSEGIPSYTQVPYEPHCNFFLFITYSLDMDNL